MSVMAIEYRDNDGRTHGGAEARALLDKLLHGTKEQWENGAGGEALIAPGEAGPTYLTFTFADSAGFHVRYQEFRARPLVALPREARSSGKRVTIWSGGDPRPVSRDQCVEREEARAIADHFLATGEKDPGFEWAHPADLDEYMR
jgi:hypothetical protein